MLSVILVVISVATNDSQVVRTRRSFGTSIPNTQIYSVVEYQGQKVYIYESLSNHPKNQIYYYAPIIFPKRKSSNNWIWTSGNGELRVTVMFGNDEIDEMVRSKIMTIGENRSFDVTSLIIDSFSAFIVSTNSEPVPGVHPFRSQNANDKTMTLRFQCSSEVIAQKVMSHVIKGEYDVEFAFFFAGFKKVSTNMVSITGDSLKSVLSKTTADGENAMATYIHRLQTNKFISSYLANVRKMIYKENPESDTSSLTIGLEEQFVSLMQQGMMHLSFNFNSFF